MKTQSMFYDFKHTKTRKHIEYTTAIMAIAFLVMIAVSWIDYHHRDQLHQQAAEAIAERDRYIDNLENILYQTGIMAPDKQYYNPTSL